MSDLIFEEETYAINGAVFEVYKTLGCGFAEEVYQDALEKEFTLRGIPFAAQPRVQISYKGQPVREPYIPDFICYGKIILELKAVDRFSEKHFKQVSNYLAATGLQLALLANFGCFPRAVVKRFVQTAPRGRVVEDVDHGDGVVV